MVRTTTADATDESNTIDLTRFLRAAADDRRDFEADFDDVTTSITATKESGCGDDDFDDDGNYVADDPVFVEARIERTVVTDRVDATVGVMVDAVTDRDDFAVTDVDRNGFFRAPAADTGKPAGGSRDASHYKITVTARRRID